MGIPTRLTEPAHAVAALLVERGETLAVCESSAGGLISAALLSYPGASRFYRGGTVIYTLAGATVQLAGSSVARPEPLRGACEPFARYLATAAADLLDADWAISETGATGPRGNSYGDPAGHAWVAVAGPSSATEHVLTGAADREQNMIAFAAAALDLLQRILSS